MFPEPFKSRPGHERSRWHHVWPLLVFLTVLAALVVLVIVAVLWLVLVPH